MLSDRLRGVYFSPPLVYHCQVINQPAQMTNVNYLEEGISNEIDAALECAEIKLTEAQTQKMFEIVLERATDSISDIIGDLINEM